MDLKAADDTGDVAHLGNRMRKNSLPFLVTPRTCLPSATNIFVSCSSPRPCKGRSKASRPWMRGCRRGGGLQPRDLSGQSPD